MRDGLVQGLLPYSDNSIPQDQFVTEDEEGLGSVQIEVHPRYEDDLTRLGENLPRVFSYHLAWSGDVAQAQRQTEKTVARCARWIAIFHGGKTSAVVWMLRMASYVRRTTREKEASGWLGMASIEEPMDLPDLSKLALLSIGLKRMPMDTAEALVLTCFAGLNPVEAGSILGVHAAKVEPLVQAGLVRHHGTTTKEPDLLLPAEEVAGLRDALEKLARAIQPDPAWLEKVKQQLLSTPFDSRSRLLTWLDGPAFFWEAHLKGFQNWSLWLLPLLLIGAIVLGWWLKNPQPTPGPALEVMPVTESSTRQVLTNQPSTGYLVPSDPAICQDWQKVIAKNTLGKVSFQSMMSYREPEQNQLDVEIQGTACQVEVVGSALRFAKPKGEFRYHPGPSSPSRVSNGRRMGSQPQ